MPIARLLLIEDDADSAEAVRLLLEMEDLEVCHAATGRAALALYEESRRADRPFDVIFMDLMLPDTTGRDLSRNLARIAPLPPVIVHSAARGELMRATIDELGPAAAEIVRKPADWERVREALRLIVARTHVRAGH